MTDVLTRPDETTGAAPARKWHTTDWARALAVVLAWHAVLTAVAVLFQGSLPIGEGYPVKVLGPDATLLSHTYRWDAENFHQITNGGYANEATPWVPAFYPFFPFCVWLVETITFGVLGFLAAGMVVNVLATWLAAVALLRIARHFVTGERAPWLVVAAFLTAPTAFFAHSFYSEAVFCALGFWAYLFALRRQWVWMGLALIPLTATRITAVLFVGLCFLEFFRAKDWKVRGLLSWHLLWFPAAGLGVAAYALVLKIVKNDPLAMFSAYDTVSTWSYHVANPNIPATLWTELKVSLHVLAGGRPNNWDLISHVLPLFGLGVLLALSVYLFVALKKDGLPLAGFGLASFVMFTLNSNVVSVHRYLLPCVVIYVAMVVAAQRRPALKPALYGWMYASSLVQAGVFLLFVSGAWAG